MIMRALGLPFWVAWVALLGTQDAAAGNRIARIDVEQSGPRRTVRIATQQPPVFATYLLDEAREVLVDIADGDMQDIAGPLQVRDGVLSDVSFRQFQTGKLLVSRVVIGLTVNCSTVVQAEGNVIIVHACNGATDIPADPTPLASTEAMGVEAFAALAKSAGRITNPGPDLPAWIDDALGFDPTTWHRKGAMRTTLEARAASPKELDPQTLALLNFGEAAAAPLQSTQVAAPAAKPAPAAQVAAAPAKSKAMAIAARPFGKRRARRKVAVAAVPTKEALEAHNRDVVAQAERRFARGRAARAAKRAMAQAEARRIETARRQAIVAARAQKRIERHRARAERLALLRAKRQGRRAEKMAQAPGRNLGPMIIAGRRDAFERSFDAGNTSRPQLARGGPIVIEGRRPPLAVAAAQAPDDTGPLVIWGEAPQAPKVAVRHVHKATLVAVQRVDHRRILLRVQGGGRFKARHLADPPRFVVDLSGIRRDTSEKFYTMGSDQHASRVRLGDQDFGVRAVFDLRDHRTQARVRRTKDGLLVAFSGELPPESRAHTAPSLAPDLLIKPAAATQQMRRAQQADEGPETDGAAKVQTPSPQRTPQDALPSRAKSG